MKLNFVAGIKDFLRNVVLKGVLNEAFEALSEQKDNVINELDNLAIEHIKDVDLPFLEGKDELEVKAIIRLISKAVATSIVLGLIANADKIRKAVYEKLKA